MKGTELKEKMNEAGRKIIEKAKNVGNVVIEKGRNGVKWVIDNPDKAAALTAFGAAVTGGANKLIRSVNRNVTVRHEMKEKRTRIYDHSMGAYLYTKRPLKAEEVAKINKVRRQTGKRTSEILEEMRLLKK